MDRVVKEKLKEHIQERIAALNRLEIHLNEHLTVLRAEEKLIETALNPVSVQMEEPQQQQKTIHSSHVDEILLQMDEFFN